MRNGRRADGDGEKEGTESQAEEKEQAQDDQIMTHMLFLFSRGERCRLKLALGCRLRGACGAPLSI